MSLDAVVGLRKGTLDLDVELRVASNGVVVLLGPNAAGKTTYRFHFLRLENLGVQSCGFRLRPFALSNLITHDQ